MKFVTDETGRRVAVDHIVWYRKGEKHMIEPKRLVEQVQARTILGQDHTFDTSLDEFDLLVGAKEEAKPGGKSVPTIPKGYQGEFY